VFREPRARLAEGAEVRLLAQLQSFKEKGELRAALAGGGKVRGRVCAGAAALAFVLPLVQRLLRLSIPNSFFFFLACLKNSNTHTNVCAFMKFTP